MKKIHCPNTKAYGFISINRNWPTHLFKVSFHWQSSRQFSSEFLSRILIFKLKSLVIEDIRRYLKCTTNLQEFHQITNENKNQFKYFFLKSLAVVNGNKIVYSRSVWNLPFAVQRYAKCSTAIQTEDNMKLILHCADLF